MKRSPVNPENVSNTTLSVQIPSSQSAPLKGLNIFSIMFLKIDNRETKIENNQLSK